MATRRGTYSTKSRGGMKPFSREFVPSESSQGSVRSSSRPGNTRGSARRPQTTSSYTRPTTAAEQVVETEQEFRERLRDFLRPILLAGLGENNSEWLDNLLNDEAMEIWSKAFTHETYSSVFNYEELELFGDRLLGHLFPKMLKDRYPNLRKDEYTELNNAYMSKNRDVDSQASIAVRFGLNTMVRLRGIERSNLSIETDVFESFFGALEEVGDTHLGLSKGTLLGILMLDYFFQDMQLDLERAAGAPKTIVQQLFSRFGYPQPDEVDVRHGHEIVTTISLNKDDEALLDWLGVQVDDPVIGVGRASTKRVSSLEAYRQALRTLARYGITKQYVETVRKEMDFSRPEIVPYVPMAQDRMIREGYDGLYFFIPRKTSQENSAVVELIGTKKDNPKVHDVLVARFFTLGSGDFIDKNDLLEKGKVAVIREYAGV